MKNVLKTSLHAQALLLSIFITACNGQNNTQQKTVNEIKTGSVEPVKQLYTRLSAIQTDTTKQEKLNFTSIEGHFDRVYSNIHSGFQDKAGNIWFSTTGAGTVRYDGKLFTHFTTKDRLNNNSVTPLLEDKQQNIWFGTTDGIYRYDGKNFTPIPITSTDKNKDQSFNPDVSLQSGSASIAVISAMEDTKGNIWFGTETSGVYRFDGKNLINILSLQGINNNESLRLNTITDIEEDNKGNIWFASWNNEGLCCYDGKSFVSYSTKNGLGDDMIYSISKDKTGNLWIGTRDHGVWRYDGKSFIDISGETALKNESIYSIIQDQKGNFWFATQSKGVWHYDGKTFTSFTVKDGLSNNSVFCIVEAKNGHLWFGTRGMGLSQYDGKTFTNYTKQ